MSDAEPVGDREFDSLMAGCKQTRLRNRVAVGVSGGADSLALCLLASNWARDNGVQLTALTVDHGLRSEAADEARQVADWLAQRQICHRILSATGARPTTGIQRIARQRRLEAINAWCRDHDHPSVLFAHTAEDQAETLWMRVGADSGPDGLAAIAPETRLAGLTLARPLLTVPKRRLTATCRVHDQSWIEDPSNHDLRHARVRLRQCAGILAECGLGVDEARRFAGAMAAARRAIDTMCCRFMQASGSVSPAGHAWFDRDAFSRLPPVFADALLRRLLRALGGGTRAPRQRRVTRLAERLRGGGTVPGQTLAGCLVVGRREGIVRVCRESAGLAPPVLLQPGRRTRWDNRFEAVWHGAEPAWLGAAGPMGAALAKTTLPHATRLAVPAIRMLDGTVHHTHLSGVDDDLSCSGAGVEVTFSPDDEWIGWLAANDRQSYT